MGPGSSILNTFNIGRSPNQLHQKYMKSVKCSCDKSTLSKLKCKREICVSDLDSLQIPHKIGRNQKKNNPMQTQYIGTVRCNLGRCKTVEASECNHVEQIQVKCNYKYQCVEFVKLYKHESNRNKKLTNWK